LYTVVLNQEQLRVVQEALEVYSRLGIGQLDNVLYSLGFRTYDQYKDIIVTLDQPSVKRTLQDLMSAVFKKSYSIRGEEVHENFKISYDLYSVIRNKLGDSIFTVKEKVSKNGDIDIQRNLVEW